jgi:serine/threonine-protein kinase RsbW
MKNEIDIKIKVPNQTRYLSLIGRIGEDLAHQLDGYNGDKLALANSINVVLTEAMVNAIKHANEGDPEKMVEVRITITDNDLLIKVYDSGQGFDLSTVPDPVFDNIEFIEDRGRGVFIIRSLMDSVAYKKIAGGNVLEMRKKLVSS